MKASLLSLFLVFLLTLTRQSLAQQNEEITERIFGVVPTERFSYHEPSYLVFGDDDLKLQYSFKYRLSRKLDLYLSYTQLMFWAIYDESKPFSDINYRPE